MKGKGERERRIQLNADFQRTAQRDKKAFFNDQCIKPEENNRGETLELSSGILVIPRGHFTQRWAQKRTYRVDT